MRPTVAAWVLAAALLPAAVLGAPASIELRGWESVPPWRKAGLARRAGRVLLLPPRWFAKGFLYPFEEAAAWADRHAVVERAVELLYNDDRTAGVVPTAEYRNVQGLSAGAKAFDENVLEHGETFYAGGKYGGAAYHELELGFESAQLAGAPVWLDAYLRREANPALQFVGIGLGPPPARAGLLDPRAGNVESRYSARRDLAVVRSGYGAVTPICTFKTGVSAIYRKTSFGPLRRDASSDEPSIEEVYDVTRLAGFQAGEDHLELTVDLEVDTTNRRGHPSRGGTLEAYWGGVPIQHGVSYWHYGAVAAGYVNLYRETRVLVVRAGLEAVDERGKVVPFSALPRLGGARTLRGYKRGYFRDRRAAFTTLEYRYPVHDKVLGQVYLDAGTLGGEYEGLARTWRTGYGFGFLLGGKNANNVKIDLSFGEEFEAFISFDPMHAFYDRTRRL